MTRLLKPLVYIAAPLTKPEPMANTHRAVKVASRLRDNGLVVPFVPHLTCLWHLIDPAPWETWLAYDLAILDRCDAVLRLRGESTGADMEVAHAEKLGLPVFFMPATVEQWASEEWHL